MENDGSEMAISNYKYVPKHIINLGINKNVQNSFFSIDYHAYGATQGHLESIPAQNEINTTFGLKQKLENRLSLIHSISLLNLTNSKMLTPEYIRKRDGVNTIPNRAYGSSITYSLKLEF